MVVTIEHIIQVISSAGVFLVLWWVLSKFVFAPFFANYEERQARTAGDESLANEKRQETKHVAARIEQQLRISRLDGIRLRDEQIARAKEEAQKIIDRASAEAAEELSRAELHIRELKQKARAELPKEIEQLSELVVSRALATDATRTVH